LVGTVAALFTVAAVEVAVKADENTEAKNEELEDNKTRAAKHAHA
jgi:hypothetical protein